MVYVNTVVLVQARLGLGEESVALAFAGFGAGSMLAAFLLPRMLDRLADRPVMIGGAGADGRRRGAGAAGRRPGRADRALGGDRLRLFPDADPHRADHQPFRRARPTGARSLPRSSRCRHACWLVTYPLAGWLGSAFGLAQAALGLAAVGQSLQWLPFCGFGPP